MISFSIEGPLRAYRRIRDAGSYKPYQQFKNRVYLTALASGFSSRHDRDTKVSLRLDVYWNRAARMDLSNAVKAIEDSLWKDDRGVSEIIARSHPDSGRELAQVVLEALP